MKSMASIKPDKIASKTPHSFTNASENAKCPHCQSLLWVKIKRNLLQKITHPHQNLCFCRNCNQEFWRPR